MQTFNFTQNVEKKFAKLFAKNLSNWKLQWILWCKVEGTVSGAIFDGFFEVFWIFLKNEHGKVKGTYTEPGGVEKIKPYVLDKSALSLFNI